MKTSRLMVVLALFSVGCVAPRAAVPLRVCGDEVGQGSCLADTVISDRGTPIAGQQYCWLYLETPTYLQPVGWHECEGTRPLIWEVHDRQTELWVPES